MVGHKSIQHSRSINKYLLTGQSWNHFNALDSGSPLNLLTMAVDSETLNGCSTMTK